MTNRTSHRHARRRVERIGDDDVARFALTSGLSLSDAEARLAAHRHETAMAKLRAKGWDG